MTRTGAIELINPSSFFASVAVTMLLTLPSAAYDFRIGQLLVC
jgi:hypothetical protein